MTQAKSIQKRGEKMKKRMLCLLSVLLVGVLILSSCGCIKETKEEPKEVFGDEKMKTLPAGWKWYVNETLGMRIGYPGDWKVKEDQYESIDKVLFEKAFSENEAWGDMLSIDSEEIEEDYDLTKHTADTSYSKEYQEKFIIGGKPGIKVTLEMRVGEKKPCLNTWIYAIHKGRVFEFSFLEEDGEYVGLIYKVLDTVQFF
jgi:hypothetical protein